MSLERDGHQARSDMLNETLFKAFFTCYCLMNPP